jgi:hypothetical protein
MTNPLKPLKHENKNKPTKPRNTLRLRLFLNPSYYFPNAKP